MRNARAFYPPARLAWFCARPKPRNCLLSWKVTSSTQALLEETPALGAELSEAERAMLDSLPE